MLELLWEYNQHKRLKELEARSQRHEFNESQAFSDLDHRLARMTLINQAMWEILSAKLGVTEAELVAKIREIDLRDGVLDGRMRTKKSSPPHTCPKCRRTQAQSHSTCVFCGTGIPATPPRRPGA